MKKLTSSHVAKTLATGLVVATLTLATNVSADSSQILNDANRDFDNTYSISNVESTYSSDSNQTATILDKNQYDYEQQRTDLEEAEFAAFEVPDALVVSD